MRNVGDGLAVELLKKLIVVYLKVPHPGPAAGEPLQRFNRA